MTLITRRKLIQVAAATAVTSAYGREAVRPFTRTSTMTGGVVPVVLDKVTPQFHPMPFESQSLSGLLADRMHVNLERRLLNIDQQGLLDPFVHRHTSSNYQGEHAGKFLDAACNVLRYSDSQDLSKITSLIANGLMACQEADGYLGTYPEDHRWMAWDVWVHKYSLIGLLSYYQLTGERASLETCRKMADLLCRTFGDDAGMLDITATGVHLGMNATSVLEPICTLYRLTGEDRYLKFAQYIVSSYDKPNGPHIISSLLSHGSVYHTANGKAYEMLSNFNGILELYFLTGDRRLFDAVVRGWNDIKENQLYFTGTVSACEHFQPPDGLLSLQSSNVGETCATVTWIQLNWRLLRLTADPKFGQEIERSVYNHLLAAQHPENGNVCYYTSLFGRKEYTNYLFCCVSSGPRGISLIPQLVWGLEGNAIFINLYCPGEVQTEINGVLVTISVDTRFPEDGRVSIRVSPQRALPLKLRLRVPEWSGRFEAMFKDEKYKGAAGQMLDIQQVYAPDSVVSVDMDIPIRTIQGAPRYPTCTAIQRGPQILALDKAVNPGVPFLSRVGLKDVDTVRLRSEFLSTSGRERRVYLLDGVMSSGVDTEKFDEMALRLVPFAEAADYRVWITRKKYVRKDVPPVTAYQRATMSDTDARLEPTDQQRPWTDRCETITDERTDTFVLASPPPPRSSTFKENETSEQREVWFCVLLDAPKVVSRLVFRHGPVSDKGGAFRALNRRPRIEALLNKPKSFDRSLFIVLVDMQDDMKSVSWEDIGEFKHYPTKPNDVKSWVHFEHELERPQMVYGIRVVGDCNGENVSCAELSAYST